MNTLGEIYTEADWRSDLAAAGVTDLAAVLRERSAATQAARAAEPATCAIGACPNDALPGERFCLSCLNFIYFGDDHRFGDYE
jgi:hypothetical protein